MPISFDDIIAPAPRPELPGPPTAPAPPERYHRRGLSLRTAPVDEETDWITLDELPEMLHAATTTYLNDPHPGYALLIAAPAGAGKTYHATRLAEQVAAGGRRVLYCGPNRSFWYDVQAEQQRPSWWYMWQPRSQGDLEATPVYPPTCRWEPQISAWMQRGYEAMDFCSNPRICGWRYIKESCPYHRQKERSEPVVFGQHAHAALGHPLMKNFHLLIGDELPISAFLHRWNIPLSAIVPAGIHDHDVETLLRNLKWLCVNPPDGAAFWSGADLYRYGLANQGGAAGVVRILERYRGALADIAYAPDLRSAGAAEDAPFFHLLTLAQLLLREAGQVAAGAEEIIGRVRLGADGLTLLLRHAPPDNLPQHIVWLDATGDSGIYETLLHRPIKTIRPRIKLRGTIYQLWASVNNRSAMLDERTSIDGQSQGEHKTDVVRRQIRRILDTHEYQQPAVISYKPLADKIIPGAPHTHFGAARGTNALQSCDVLFVIGAPMPSTTAITELAAQVFFERDEPFRTEWHALDVPFSGQAAAHSVGGFWNDADLTLLLRQLREAEIVQAVHRARPLRRPVDVWLLTNVVAPGLPVQLVSLAELYAAVDADGRAITGVDLERWPQVLNADATPDEPLTPARLMDAFAISKPTANRWYAGLRATGRYDEIAIKTGQRGPKTRGLVKRLSTRNSYTPL